MHLRFGHGPGANPNAAGATGRNSGVKALDAEALLTGVPLERRCEATINQLACLRVEAHYGLEAGADSPGFSMEPMRALR